MQQPPLATQDNAVAQIGVAVLAALAQARAAGVLAEATQGLARLAAPTGFAVAAVLRSDGCVPLLVWTAPGHGGATGSPDADGDAVVAEARTCGIPATRGRVLAVPVRMEGRLAGIVRLDWPRGQTAAQGALNDVVSGIGAAVLRGGLGPAQDLAARSADMVVITDAARRITWVNPAFEAYTGWTLAEATGRNPGALLQAPDTCPDSVGRIRATLDAGEAVRVELLNRARGGRRYWVDLDIQPIRNSDGRLAGFIAVQTDITSRKMRDARLRAAEIQASAERARLVSAIMALPDPVALFDAEERLVIANDRFCELYAEFAPSMRPGVSLEEMHRDLLARDPPAAAQGREDAWLAERLAALRGTPRVQEVALPDGRWFRKLDVPTDDGGLMRIRIDITHRRRQQDELERLASEASAARNLLEAAVSVLPDAFVVFDRHDRLVLCNDRYREMYPLSAPAIRPGVLYEDILRLSVQSGEVADAIGCEEAWIAQRLSEHHHPHNDREYRLSDGRWLRVIERTMPDGNRVSMRSDITALKAAEQRLADIIAGAHIGTWEWYAASGQSIVNPRYAEILGYPADGFSPVPEARFQSFLHPDDAPRINASLARTFAGEVEFYDEELRLRHADGHWVWVQARGRVTRRDAKGRAMVFAGVYLDISERKALEARLEAERGFLARLMETSVSGIVALDAEGRAVFANREAERLLGIPPGAPMPFDLDSIGWRRETLEGAPLDPAQRAFRRVLSTGEVVRDARRAIVWPDGQRRCLSVNAAPLNHPASGARVVTSVTDITEQLDTEADLRRALAEEARTSARFAEVAAISRSWVWEQDADLRFTYQSESIADLIGLDNEEAIGRTREELYARRTDVRRSADWGWLDARLAAREPFSDFVFQISDTNGRDVFIELSGKPMFDDAGRFTGYRGAGRDVSALIQARLAAEAANRTKSDFLATMSHEIRTPLNGVLGMADLLHSELEDPHQREMVAVIRNSGRGLLTILNDILDMSKIEAGKLTLETVAFEPAALLSRTVALHAPVARDRGLTLTATCDPPDATPRLGDPHRLQQVLHNLMSNAIRFTDAGEVSLHLSAPDDGPLRLRVEDTGIGMSDAQLARLFQAFEQADSSISRRFGGTGLGSSIVKNLVDLMGGAITVDSRPGTGTRVEVSLPLALAPIARSPDLPAPADPTPPAPSLAGLRLLVADDNATNRKLLELILRNAGAAPTLVEDGQAALDAWAPGQFDALLLDISMPGMDGVEALAAIRAAAHDAGQPRPPALAITANAMTHQVQGYLDAGFDAHVPKPFRSEALVATIARIVGGG